MQSVQPTCAVRRRRFFQEHSVFIPGEGALEVVVRGQSDEE